MNSSIDKKSAKSNEYDDEQKNEFDNFFDHIRYSIHENKKTPNLSFPILRKKDCGAFF